MLITWVPLLVAIIGLIMYLACKDKLVRVGEILFFCGVLVTLLAMGARTIHIP